MQKLTEKQDALVNEMARYALPLMRQGDDWVGAMRMKYPTVSVGLHCWADALVLTIRDGADESILDTRC